MNATSSRKYAVVTGASSGIGYELANLFAQNGFDVLAIAEDSGISDAARRLSAGGGSVQPLQVDLASHEGTEELVKRLQSENRSVDALAVNAGVGVSGAFHENSLRDELNLVKLNVLSAVHLTHEVLKQMVGRHEGRVLITSSIAATMPGPFMSTYNASKAFLKSFAEGIREELKDTGVTVTALMPGPTETNFFDRAGMQDTKLGAMENKDSAADVAREGFEALMAGKDHVVAGSFMNKVQATVAHVLPDTAMAGIHRKQSEPGTANK